MKRFAFAAALVLVAAGSAAVAKDKIDPRIQTVLTCGGIADNAQRLACYDRAIGGFKQALAAGQLIASTEAQRPFAMEGTVAAAGPMGFNHFWAVMNTGDRWDVTMMGSHDDVPRKGAKVTIGKSFSGYMFREQNSPDRHAHYLGRD
jgi:hypothetical protein